MHVDFWQKKTHTGGRALYGKLYERLAHETDDPAYAPIRKIMYDVSLDSLPLGPGDEMFGRVAERRIHSVHSAAQEFKIHPKTLRKLLKSANLVLGSDALTDERILLPKDEMSAMVDRLRGNLTTGDASEYLGVTRTLWETLIRGHHITSFSGGHTHGMHELYRTTDLDAFLAKVRSFATQPFEPSLKLMSIGATVKRANCKFSELLDLLFEGKLQRVAIDPGKTRMKSILFDPNEVARLTELPHHDGLSIADAAKAMKIQSLVFRNLVRKNWIESSIETNPNKRSKQRVVRPSVVQKFDSEYITLFNLAREYRMNIGAVKRDLEGIGIFHAISQEDVGATFYRRSDFFCKIE